MAIAVGPARALRSLPWRRDVLSPPVLAWLAHIIVVFAVAAVTVALTPERDDHRPRLSGIGHYLIAPLATWDGGWYVRIAEQGYSQEEAAAFWPLYPLLLDLGATITWLHPAMVGVVLSNLFFLGALIFLFVLVRADYGRDVAKRTVWLVALSPLAFYFSAVYTEALFLLLTVGALSLAHSGRWTWAALAAALAALTRNSGVLILVPLSVMVAQQRGWRPARWFPYAIQLSAAGMAPAVFAVHLDRIWGDPLLPIHIQERWGRVRSMPWDTLRSSFHQMHRTYATGRHSCEMRMNLDAWDTCRAALDINALSISDDLSFMFVTGCLALMPYAVWRLLPRDSLYLVAGFVVPLFGPATFDPLLSMARYLTVLFPLYIALALVLRWQPLLVLTVAISTLALCGVLSLFAQRYFVT